MFIKIDLFFIKCKSNACEDLDGFYFKRVSQKVGFVLLYGCVNCCLINFFTKKTSVNIRIAPRNSEILLHPSSKIYCRYW